MAYFSQKQVDKLKESNIQILEALARYRYLTSRQIIALGITAHRSQISRIMGRFEYFTKPLIERSKFSETVKGHSGRRAKEDIITLTKRGAECLIDTQPDSEDDLKFVHSKDVSARDYEHTRETVDFHILVDQFADMYACTVDCFHTYHDHTGANNGKLAAQGINLRRRQTTFTVPEADDYGRANDKEHKFSADAIFHMTDPTGQGHLFAVEIQRGQDTKRLCEKLRDHYIPAIAEGTISADYGVEYNPKVLVICENRSLVENTLKRLADDPEFEFFHKSFAFHTIEDLQGTTEGFDIAVEAPKGLAWSISKATREYIAFNLKDCPNWQQIMNDDPNFSEHPKRLAKGWRFIGGKVGTIF